ncbi:MAG: flagellar hook-length control protein FliK [Pseudomonadota bacterium]
MLPRTDLTISPVGRAEALSNLDSTADPRQQAFQRSMASLLGRSLQGDILSKLTDGSYLVKVAGASARMLLPPGSQVGTQVPLTLVALTPRPTFQISSQAGPVAYAEAGPALLPGAAGAPARAAPLVYLEGSVPAAAAAPARPPAAAPAAPVAAPADSLADDVDALLAQQARTPSGLFRAPAPGLAPADPELLPAPGPAPSAVAAGVADEPAAAAPPLPGAPAKGGAEAALRTTSHAAALLRQAPIVPASELPAIDPASTPASISDTARVITSVLTAALQGDKAPSAIVARGPLADAPTVAPEKMAAALKDAVSKSGLFYESHVAEWSAGKRALAELMHEPQMQRFHSAIPEAGLRPQAGLPDHATAQFINLQLQTQEQARIAWQGQPWPGQDMHWEIQRDAPERQHGGDEAPPPTWRSALRLRFAALGEVNASVVMVGDQIHIQLEAGASGIGALLREHAGELNAAMEASGNPLSSLNIRAGRGSHGR